jgi:hypothetical protein
MTRRASARRQLVMMMATMTKITAVRGEKEFEMGMIRRRG